MKNTPLQAIITFLMLLWVPFGGPLELSQPTQASSLTFTAIAGSWNHTCALTTNGAVYCWGRNDYGQLGFKSPYECPTPHAVPALPGAARGIAAGGQRTCILTEQGEVWCWAGTGMLEKIAVPKAVEGLESRTTALAMGDDQTCALLSNGGVQCWSGYDESMFGNEPTRPEKIQRLSGTDPGEIAASIAVGGEHACALLANGGVRCWGYNYQGQLGEGTTTDRLAPVDVIGREGKGLLEGIAAIATGRQHTCALTHSGEVWCWGRNDDGQLGIALTASRSSPVRVSRLPEPATAIAAGAAHTCALLQSGQIWCWGSNANGQLGTGNTRSSSVPLKTADLPSVVTLAAGGWHTCALTASGELWCWGWNMQGQLGDGATIDRTRPVRVIAPASPPKATTSPANNRKNRPPR